MRELNYPVLQVAPIGVGASGSEWRLTTRSEMLFDQRSKIGDFIIDSTGDRYRITGQRKVAHAGIIPWWLRRYSRRWVRVDFDLEYVDRLDLDAVKELVLPVVRKRRKGQYNYDTYAIKAIREAETLAKLMRAVGIAN